MKTTTQICMMVCLLWIGSGALAFSQVVDDPDLDYEKKNGSITLNAENIELSKLLRLLSLNEKKSIVSSGPLDMTVCVNLFNVSLEQVLESVLKPIGYGYRIQQGVYQVMTTEDLTAFLSPPPPIKVRLFRLDYLNLDEAQKFIQPFLSETGQVVVGEKSMTGLTEGESDSGGETSALTNVVLVKDFVPVLDRISEALEALDIQPRQVLLEATILEVFLNDRCKLGVDFTALGGLDFTDLNATSDFFSVSYDDASGSQLSDTLIGAQTDGFANNNPEEGFTFGLIHDEVGVFIEAIESVTDTNVIANPKVIALNRQKAEIIIGGRLGYYGTSTVSDGIAQQSVEFLETGTQLRFRPFIAGDGFVRLEVHPERSTGVIDPTTGLPSENTSELTTNIMIKGGDTVVIGGLIEEKDSQIEKRIPFFGSIPLLGWLFRSKENETRRTELIVMITPYILDPADGDGEAEAIRREYREKKQLFRDGFIIGSRTIYAYQHMEKAKKCLLDGSAHWAKYHIERAVDLNPYFDPIYELKKRIDDSLAAGESEAGPMEVYLQEASQ